MLRETIAHPVVVNLSSYPSSTFHWISCVVVLPPPRWKVRRQRLLARILRSNPFGLQHAGRHLVLRNCICLGPPLLWFTERRQLVVNVLNVRHGCVVSMPVPCFQHSCVTPLPLTMPNIIIK